MEKDEKIAVIFNYLKRLEKLKREESEFKHRRKIGYKQGNSE